MKLIVATIFTFFSVFAQDSKLKTGDILFQSMNCGPLCEAINEVTAGYNNLDFNHLGVVSIENDTVFVYEASGEAVKKTQLIAFQKYTTLPIYIGRLKKKHRKLIPDAIQFLQKQLGVPYDDTYLYDNGKYYCSELLYDAFLFANKKPLFQLQPMTFKSPETNTYFQVWQDYYSDLKMEVPEGQLGCNPGGISLSRELKIIGIVQESKSSPAPER